MRKTIKTDHPAPQPKKKKDLTASHLRQTFWHFLGKESTGPYKILKLILIFLFFILH